MLVSIVGRAPGECSPVCRDVKIDGPNQFLYVKTVDMLIWRVDFFLFSLSLQYIVQYVGVLGKVKNSCGKYVWL